MKTYLLTIALAFSFALQSPALAAQPELREKCSTVEPILGDIKSDHRVACHLYEIEEPKATTEA